MSTEHVELIPLWPNPSGSQPDTEPHGRSTVLSAVPGHQQLRVIRNVTQPACTVHPADPDRATGSAVIICPGGSFVVLTETATEVANRLAAQGITAFVLRYRLLPTAPSDEEFQREWASAYTMDEIKAQSRLAAEDARRAVGMVRARAAEWNLDPHRVGILGFSAGGLLTVSAATDYEPATRPDFAAPIYPPIWHEYRVPPDAPPLFLCFAADDPGENVVGGNLALHQDWRTAGHSVEMHAYAEGGHGFAEAAQGLPCDSWLDRYLEWHSRITRMEPAS
ncbi:alpha/beta hydrolase [Nocardia goodfellowii]|uniref:Acetyl esterase/lipase n=1 Tax=Nocardia goodfellowii TaxID=882446 RepID=A0ABS4QHZ9_9NOCA|nr:alpha/beta hydrolase [Nocardia goodfellowii]MBP2191328.1 acetyl esterase/lipase [Nocardia goodfellowii]